MSVRRKEEVLLNHASDITPNGMGVSIKLEAFPLIRNEEGHEDDKVCVTGLDMGRLPFGLMPYAIMELRAAIDKKNVNTVYENGRPEHMLRMTAEYGDEIVSMDYPLWEEPASGYHQGNERYDTTYDKLCGIISYTIHEKEGVELGRDATFEDMLCANLFFFANKVANKAIVKDKIHAAVAFTTFGAMSLWTIRNPGKRAFGKMEGKEDQVIIEEREHYED